MTKQILYKATNPQGKALQDYISANSNEEAFQLLTEKGYTDIEFLSDAFTGISQPGVTELDAKSRASLARFDANVRKNPGTLNYCIEVIRLHKAWIVTGSIILCWGIYANNLWAIIGGTITALGFPLLQVRGHLKAKRYTKIISDSALGNWEPALKNIETLKKSVKERGVLFDLDIRKACILAAQKKDPCLSELEQKWKNVMSLESPGIYHSRLSSIYYKLEDFEQYLQCQREAYFQSNQTPITKIDLAMGEIRYGDLHKAGVILKSISEDYLPNYGKPYLTWVNASYIKHNDSQKAEKLYISAINGLSEFVDNPAVWSALAMCVADFACAAQSEHAIDQARRLLQQFKQIIVSTADSITKNTLCEKFPEFDWH